MSRVVQSAREALAFAKGELDEGEYTKHEHEIIDVRRIREKLGMTQDTFANVFGFKLATLQLWEQRKRTPEDLAKTYLTVIDRAPEAVRQALQARHT